MCTDVVSTIDVIQNDCIYNVNSMYYIPVATLCLSGLTFLIMLSFSIYLWRHWKSDLTLIMGFTIIYMIFCLNWGIENYFILAMFPLGSFSDLSLSCT